jgi:hypothetical protein
MFTIHAEGMIRPSKPQARRGDITNAPDRTKLHRLPKIPPGMPLSHHNPKSRTDPNYHALLAPSGADQNAVKVEHDFSDLEPRRQQNCSRTPPTRNASQTTTASRRSESVLPRARGRGLLLAEADQGPESGKLRAGIA